MCTFWFTCKHIIVNTCYIYGSMGVRNASNSKVTFKVTQRHRQWCHLHIQLPISLPLQNLKLCLSILHLFRNHSFPKILDHMILCIPFRDNLSCIHCYYSASISATNLMCLVSPTPKIRLGPKDFTKLAPDETDGRLFASDVSANFEVTWYKKTKPNIINPARNCFR